MNEHAVEHAIEEAHEHFGHDNSPEAIRKEIRRYLIVFAALGALTIVTVAISLLHLPTHLAILLALTVAVVKGSLVAAFFMHLISERKLIYAVLLLTVFFFGMLLWGPWHQRYNAQKVWKGYDLNASQPAPAAPIENSGHSGH
ncbi:MAG: cytochrome C oxidase subunit IV family protein [Acidobacteria bacterium]|nr:cytochrome C oxidase subunit IV family protein [Acidobacteriota bacterium]MBV9477880.1 cytochrome C oxidase subunit IV family protein [Acidobacteriota bacterium]